MTRIVDKRNVCIVSTCTGGGNAEIQLYKRGTLSGGLYGKYEDKIEVPEGGAVVESLATPDMVAVVPTFISGNANVTAQFNGVTVPATELSIGGDTYKLWGFKPQDFVLFNFT